MDDILNYQNHQVEVISEDQILKGLYAQIKEAYVKF